RKDPIIQVRYAKSDINVRNYNNLKHIVGKMSRGEFIKGRVIGDYIIEQKTGIDVAVYRHILSVTPIPYAGYAIPNTNVRNAPCGSVLGKYSQSTYVSGTWQGNWLKIQFQGKTGYIYHSQLRKNTPDQSVTNQTSFTGADGTVVEGTALTYGEMERFLALINQHRKNNGAAPLAYNYNWLAGGNIRAAEIAYNFSHTRPDGSHWTTAVQLENVTWKGENIAWGYPTVESVFEIWKNSPAHNDNMLNPNYNVVMFTGITSNYGYRTWATIFSRIEPW
ncbi:MAG: CAP domain-containing protein, partial [Saccharofermentanales bacterium]